MPPAGIYDTRNIWRQEYGQLNFEYVSKRRNLVYSQLFPPVGVPSDVGIFHAGAETAWLEEYESDMSKWTTAKEHGEDSTPVNFNISPYAIGWAYSEMDLQNPQQFQAASREEMIQKRILREGVLMKKVRERTMYTEVNRDSNYLAANIITASGTGGWADPAADIIGDVTQVLMLVDDANVVSFNKKAFRYCQLNTAIKAATNVTGEVRDGLDPRVTANYLATLFQVDEVVVAHGKLRTDSSDPAVTTSEEIWGSKALVYARDDEPGVEEAGGWLQQMYVEIPGKTAEEGWIVTEEYKHTTGLVGSYHWQEGGWWLFKLQNINLAGRIDGLYA